MAHFNFMDRDTEKMIFNSKIPDRLNLLVCLGNPTLEAPFECDAITWERISPTFLTPESTKWVANIKTEGSFLLLISVLNLIDNIPNIRCFGAWNPEPAPKLHHV